MFLMVGREEWIILCVLLKNCRWKLLVLMVLFGVMVVIL